MRPACAPACLGLLLLAGCSAVGGLFDNDSLVGKGVGAIADSGSDIVKAADSAFSGPSYCRQANSTEVYQVDAGDCRSGDTAIKSYEYNAQKAENEQKAWQQLHAAALAEAAQPTYCRTATAHIAYRASAKTCQPGEATITKEEYDAAKAEAAAAATRMP
jgi:hypothetical protein